MVDYKDRLSDAMKAAGMTTSALAGKLELTYQAVDKVLKGNTKELTASNNSRAAQILGVNTDWLATGKGPQIREAPPQSAASDKPDGYLSPSEISELISLFAACDNKGRALILQEARSAAIRYGSSTSIHNKREAT